MVWDSLCCYVIVTAGMEQPATVCEVPGLPSPAALSHGGSRNRRGANFRDRDGNTSPGGNLLHSRYSTLQCSAVQCSTSQCSVVHCNTVQCSEVQYTTCIAVQFSVVQCTVLSATCLPSTLWFRLMEHNSGISLRTYISIHKCPNHHHSFPQQRTLPYSDCPWLPPQWPN